MSSPPLEKIPVMPPRPGFKFAREFRTEAELRNLAFDLDELRIQSLLICERVLGPHHKNFLFRLMYRGAAYADALRYQRCIDLWRRALEIRVKKDSVNEFFFFFKSKMRFVKSLSFFEPTFLLFAFFSSLSASKSVF